MKYPGHPLLKHRREGLSRIERGRKRQAMVPDFQLEVPCPTGGKVSKLAELKVINCCQTRYSPGEDKAVDKRARLLQGEYKKRVEILTGTMRKL